MAVFESDPSGIDMPSVVDRSAVLVDPVAVRHIGQRAQTDQAVQRHNERLEALRELDRRILAAQSSDEIAACAVQRIRSLVPCSRASVGLFDLAASTARIAAVDEDLPLGEPAGTVDSLSLNREMEYERSGPTRYTPDLLTIESPWPSLAKLIAFGARSLLSVPLIADDVLFGSINLMSAEPDAFDAESRLILREIADHAAVGFQQVALREDLVRQNAALAGERELLRVLMDGVDDAIYFKDAESRFVRNNRKHAERVTNPHGGSVVGKTDADFHDPEFARATFADEREIIRTGQPLLGKVERFIASDSREMWVSTSKVPWRDASGRIVGTIGIGRNITEQRQAESALRANEQRFRTLATAAPVGIFQTDAAGGCIWVNDLLCRITGLTAEMAAGQGWTRMFRPGDREHVVARWSTAVETRVAHAREIAIRRPDGSSAWISLRAAPIRDDQGVLTGYIGTIADITERKAAENAVREADSRYRTLFEQLPYGIVTFDPETLKPLAFNEAAHSMLGYSREEFAALSVFDYDVSGRPERMRAQVAMLPSVDSASFEMKTRARGGEVRDTLVSVRLIDVSGRPALLATYQDVTERNQARERLRWESDLQTALAELYRPMADPDSTIDQIARTVLHQSQRLTGAAHGYVSEVNPITGDNVGHILTDMLGGQCQVPPTGQHISFPRGDDGRYSGLWGHSLNTGESFYTNSPAEHPAARGVPAGHVQLERFLSVPVTLGTEIVGQIALANPERDFAERDLDAVKRIAEYYSLAIQRQRHEDALRAGEQRYRGIFENAGNGLIESTIGGRFLRVNERFREIVGYSEEELLQLSWKDITHPDDVAADADNVDLLIRGDISGFAMDKRYVRKDGSIVWVSLQVSAIRDASGQPIRFVGTVQDLTERRRAEQVVRVQRDLAVSLGAATTTREAGRLVLEAALELDGVDAGAVYLVDPETGVLMLSDSRGVADAFARVNASVSYDSPKARLLTAGSTIYRPRFASTSVASDSPEERAEGLRFGIIVPIIDQGQVVSCLNLGSHTNDEIPPDVRAAIEAIAAQSASAIARIRSEEELRNSERRQRDLFEHSPIPTLEEDYSAVKEITDELRASGVGDLRAHFATHPDDLARCARSIRVLGINRAALRFHGAERLDDFGTNLEQQFHSPETWEIFADEVASLADGATQFEAEKEVATLRGEVRSVIIRISAASGHEQTLDQVLVSLVDITERRRAEESLRHEQGFTRAVLESVAEGVVACDATGRLATFNRTARDWHGVDASNLSQEEWAGRYDLFRTDGTTRLPTAEIPLSRALAGENVVDAGLVIRAKGQPVRELVASGESFFDENGQRLGAVIAMRDVTQRNRAEQTARRHTQRLELLQELDQRILAAQSAEEIADFAVRRLRAAIPSDEVRLILFDPSAGVARTLAQDRIPTWPDLAHGIRPLTDFAPTDEQGPILIYYPDITRLNQPDPAMRIAIENGARSILTAPLFVAGRDLGFVNLASARVDAFSAEHQEMVREVANQVAIGLQQARLREELRQQNEELERRVVERTEQLREVNAELDSFAHSVSHDLRAPLRALRGYSQILRDERAELTEEEIGEFIERIDSSAGRMDSLIRDLLALSCAARTEIEPAPLGLGQAVAEALRQQEAVLAEKRARVEVTGDLLTVRGHRTTVVQAVANLVGNAAKYVSPGVAPEIRIHAERRDGRVRLWVADNGIGIAPEHQGRIFAAFERLHGVDEYPGTGIGLAIVKKGIERLGGKVGVESVLGHGSRFWIELLAAE